MRLYCAVVLCLSLFGCGSLVKSDTTKFDLLPNQVGGKSVLLVRLEDQKGSAAWQVYSNKVAAYLQREGFRLADSADTDYLAVISYGLSGSRTVTNAMPVYGRTGGGVSTFQGNVTRITPTYGRSKVAGTVYAQPTYGVTGYIPVTQLEHSRYFSLRLVDARASNAKGELVPAYEAAVTSEGSSATFDAVADCMMKALFKKFRGSGSDRTILAKSGC